jgi:hypothetical protein
MGMWRDMARRMDEDFFASQAAAAAASGSGSQTPYVPNAELFNKLRTFVPDGMDLDLGGEVDVSLNGDLKDETHDETSQVPGSNKRKLTYVYYISFLLFVMANSLTTEVMAPLLNPGHARDQDTHQRPSCLSHLKAIQ